MIKGMLIFGFVPRVEHESDFFTIWNLLFKVHKKLNMSIIFQLLLTRLLKTLLKATGVA